MRVMHTPPFLRGRTAMRAQANSLCSLANDKMARREQHVNRLDQEIVLL